MTSLNNKEADNNRSFVNSFIKKNKERIYSTNPQDIKDASIALAIFGTATGICMGAAASLLLLPDILKAAGQ